MNNNKLTDKQLIGIIILCLASFLLGVFSTSISFSIYEKNQQDKIIVNYIVTPGNYTVDVGENIKNITNLQKTSFKTKGKIIESETSNPTKIIKTATATRIIQ